MFTGAGVPAFASPSMNWNLIFARQPEPDWNLPKRIMRMPPRSLLPP